jgi:hypothetical protein
MRRRKWTLSKLPSFDELLKFRYPERVAQNLCKVLKESVLGVLRKTENWRVERSDPFF